MPVPLCGREASDASPHHTCAVTGHVGTREDGPTTVGSDGQRRHVKVEIIDDERSEEWDFRSSHLGLCSSGGRGRLRRCGGSKGSVGGGTVSTVPPTLGLTTTTQVPTTTVPLSTTTVPEISMSSPGLLACRGSNVDLLSPSTGSVIDTVIPGESDPGEADSWFVGRSLLERLRR